MFEKVSKEIEFMLIKMILIKYSDISCTKITEYSA